MMPLAPVPVMMPALPEIFLAIVAMALLLVGAYHRDAATSAVTTSRAVLRLALVSLAVTLLLVLTVAMPRVGPAFGGLFVVDAFAIYFKLFIIVASMISLIIGREFLENHGLARYEYTVLVLFATVGMMMMVSANDFIALYLGLEMQSLALYVVAAIHRDNLRSVEAGLKYFVLGALASGMLLYGASLVYGFAGTTGFEALATMLATNDGAAPIGLIVGLVFVLTGLAFKVSAVPFHMWTPDVYEGAPTPVTAFFSVAPKMAAIGLLLRVMMEPFGSLVQEWQQIIVVISIASMLLGGFAAIGQRNIKRLMAYSSIGHVGYALIGLAVGNEDGVRSVLIYMGIYVFMNLGVFTCILCMRRRDQMLEGIDDLTGIAKTNPALALALAVFMFSMAGIPPLAGFFGKLYVFLAAIEAGLYVLAIIGVLSSVVAAYYYLRIVRVMYFADAGEALDRDAGLGLRMVMLGSGLLILLFVLWPQPLLSGAAAAAASLFQG